ncbi:hypothetical protein BZA77DRAFT_248068 [Pyronema omphalodes]|nr:hypothetical protein BZA77DRAFT_248068 [Pyronema omphalodes]
MPWNAPALSRSPSPTRADGGNKNEGNCPAPTTPKTSNGEPGATTNEQRGSKLPRLTRSNTLGKKSRKQSSKDASSAAEDFSVLPSAVKTVKEILQTPGSPSGSFKKVKDEMWDGYKIIDADYQKSDRFSSKSGQQRTNVVRQSLLPFLRKHKERCSNHVPPEILEKRTRILHKWWAGLLQALQNRHAQQALSGADRPVYLEAISHIVSRSEWRTAPSTFAPLSDRQPLSAKSVSSASISSSSSNFSLQKSVQHNIKVLYLRMLYDTLAYAVEKMALRSAPSHLVAFAGKVCAYAFYFCPSVAEMLIGLWGLQPTVLRRVRPQFGIARTGNLQQIAEEIVCEFPESLHSLGYSPLPTLVRQLKNPTKPPVGVNVDWNGPWTSRWCGRDSDLLFVFFKWYHILMADFLPPDSTLTARLCTPGYVHVLAQMLSLIDTTIHRNVLGHVDTSSTTFEDLLNSSPSLPIPVRNGGRGMAEHKLIILLGDMLFDSHEGSRDLYATSFVTMLKAAVRKTRLYDADACFQICDILEEVLPMLSRANKQGLGDYIDWEFWLQVAQTMIKSENNMTELRTISFLYTAWDIFNDTEERKKLVCVDWLLSPQIWNRFFCHWCPMVRAYWMRLMCWRLGRYDGDATPVDTEILKTMLLRLRTGYAHHTRLRLAFESGTGRPSSTAPCLPAPSRRLVILRNDTISQPSGVLLDGIIPSTPFSATPGSLLRTQSAPTLASLGENTPPPTEEETSSSKRWSQIRSVFGFKSPEKPAMPRRASVNGSGAQDLDLDKPLPMPKVLACFKFSLEWIDRPVFGRERVLGLSRLPAQAQRYLDALPEDQQVGEIQVGEEKDLHWTYVGRALAEWVLVIVEFESFFERRKMEGKECDKEVETPTLMVEPMRKF